jgi:primosomal protein N'
MRWLEITKKLKCNNCGNIIETIPVHCGQDMTVNEETGQLECWMGPKCGYVKLDELFCVKCEETACE